MTDAEQITFAIVDTGVNCYAGSDGSVWEWQGEIVDNVAVGVWRRRRTYPARYGYRRTYLPGKRRVLLPVHHLVLEAFVGPRPEGMVCRHLDGNPSNNALGNICWGTPQENSLDMIAHGRSTRGERNPKAKLTADDVREIREAYARGENQCSIARRLKVSHDTVHLIVTGKTWKHVAPGDPVE